MGYSREGMGREGRGQGKKGKRSRVDVEGNGCSGIALDPATGCVGSYIPGWISSWKITMSLPL